jgi:hypothetical protein
MMNLPMFFLFCFAGPIGQSSFSVLPGLRSSSAHCLLNILSAFSRFQDYVFSQLKQDVNRQGAFEPGFEPS